MKKFVVGMVFAICAASLPAAAEGILNSHQSVNIKASIQEVWDAVKDFDGLHKWHPVFSDDVIQSGANEQVGTVRTLTVKDGPSFEEELLSFDLVDRKFSYRIIDPSPLPVAGYSSSFQVIEGKRGYTTILWRSSFRNNSEGKMKDEEVIGFIDGVYRAGLDSLKAALEAK